MTPAISTGASSTPPPRPQVLLDAVPQNLLRVCAIHEEPRVVAFVPTRSSSTSAGAFHVLSFTNDVLALVQIIECSEESAHCQLQDFLVAGDSIYALWDQQGQSLVETMRMEMGAIWQSATSPQETELTPPHLDELLLSAGSLAEKFYKAIMRPGMFSTVTLRTAIEQYTDACLSIPFQGPPPLQLRTTYSTLGENIAAVVGCTVNLTHDPLTGALQYDNYWSALRRDWEGFVARCREIERSARWPLTLGVSDPAGHSHIMVIERERLGAILPEDQPLWLHRSLCLSLPVGQNPDHILFEVLWILRTKLGRPAVLQIESNVIDFLQQEIAFPFADIIQDLALRVGFRDGLDEGLETWIIGRLQSIGDVQKVQDAIKIALDAIAEFPFAVKREEEEMGLIIPPAVPEWTRALTSQYAAATVQARYDLGFSLVLLLFLLAEELEDWDPVLLAEVFGVFRGTAMLLHVARQPSGDGIIESSRDGTSAADDVVSRLDQMGVSHQRSIRSKPSYSLLHKLLTQSGDTVDPPNAAHNFLAAVGLLDAGSPAHATRADVLFCERLRLVGHHYVARELLSWLPRTPGATYVLARLWLDVGRLDDATALFQSLAGIFSEIFTACLHTSKLILSHRS
jgi:nuclear pore complex protein Nup160